MPPPDPVAVDRRLAASRVPGTVLVAVRDGQVAWVAPHGHGRLNPSQPVTTATVFQTASLSKPVTALAVLALVSEGHFGLDDDLRPLLAFPLYRHPLLAAEGLGPVTARLLIEHRSGVVGRGTTPRRDGRSFLAAARGGGSRRIRQARGASVPTLRDSWFGDDGGHGVVLTTRPGERTSYSGAGYLVLQHLIEQVTGRSFADHLDGHLLPLLGCRRATFALRPPADWPLAWGHDDSGDPLPGGHELVPWSAAGGLFADGWSMGAILAAMLDNDGSVIEPGLLHAMTHDGLGTTIVRGSGPTRFRHGGDNAGYRALMVGVPARRAGVVVLTNGRATDGVRLRNDLADLVLRELL